MCNSRGEATGNSISRAPITRTALKTASGSSKWSDFEPPWSPVAQEDFSGGMGSRDFDDDTTRFLESMRANTQGKRIYLGGQETYATGLRSVNANMPGSVSWRHLLSSNGYLSVSFSASANYDIEYISVYIRRRGTPSDDLTIELCANGGGSPGTVIRSATITTDDITDTVSVFYKSTITATSVSSGTTYWITAHSANGDDENHWEIGVNNTTGTSKDSADGSTWATATVDMYFRATAAETYPKRILFKYQYAEYMLQNYASGTPKLYINGDRGVADANTGALTTLVDATKSWTVNEWAGCIVKITRGNGVGEETTYRTIVSNTATTLTVSSAWVITHNTTTEYVILGSNKFTELATATGLTASVTDVKIGRASCRERV